MHIYNSPVLTSPSTMAAILVFGIISLLSLLNLHPVTGILNVARRLVSTGYFIYGVVLVPCHSHNDYWRDIPLYSALAAGCISIEADVWPGINDLHVGHTLRTVLPGNTLLSLYFNPLLEILQKHTPANFNTRNPLSSHHLAFSSQNYLVGIFPTKPTYSSLS